MPKIEFSPVNYGEGSCQHNNHMSSAMTMDSYSTHSGSSSPITIRDDSELVVDQLAMILETEPSYHVPNIECRAVHIEDDRIPYGEWRRKICQWSFKVIDHFRLDRSVVSSAMNLFDRYLAHSTKSYDMQTCPCPSCQRSVDSRTFQLTAMTSLYIAMKMNSEYSSDGTTLGSRKLRLHSFVELSRGQFTAQDILEMEKAMLSELKWKVHPPTPMVVVSYLLRLMPDQTLIPYASRQSYDLVLHVLHELARYLTELSVCLGGACSPYSPSQVAYAAILVSMDLLTHSALPRQVRDWFNAAVVSLSSASHNGTILTPHDEAIQSLMGRLRNSFWPEMLMNDCEASEMGHPISMARDFGLLEIGNKPPTSWHPSSSPKSVQDPQISPTSVSRTATTDQHYHHHRQLS